MLDRKLLRELQRSKGLLLAITSIIAVGVMCFSAMQSTYHNLRRAKQSYYRRCRMADFWIDLKKMPVAQLGALASLPGVSRVEPRIQFAATVDLETVTEPLSGIVLSLPDRRRPVLNDLVLRRGGYFTERRMNEVIVNDSFAAKHHLGPGQWIHLVLNNRRQELLIVGTAISSEFTYLLGPGSFVPDPERFGVFYLKQRFAEAVFDFEGAANQIVGRLSRDGPTPPAETLRLAEQILEPYGVFSVTALRRQASNQFLSAEIEGLGAFATVVPAIFLIVAALVLNVLLRRLVRQQRVVIGTLKAIGYTDLQVFVHFWEFGLSVGVAGGVLGGLLGHLLSVWMTAVYRHYFEFPELPCGFYWHTHALGMCVSLLCALLGSLHGARTVLRLQPAQAMRPEAPRRGGAILLERLPAFWHLLSAGWRLALRSVFRHRMRTAASVFAATMGAGLLVNGLMLIEGMHFFVDFQFFRVARSDIDVAFKDERGEEALDEVRRLPGVDWAEPLLQVACTFVHGSHRRKGSVTGILRGATLTVPRSVQGQPIRVPDSGVVMSRGLAEILHVAPGALVTMIPVKGERRPVQLVVAKIADSYMGLTVYAEIHYLSRLVGESLAMSAAQLMTDGNARHLRQLYRRLKQTPGVQTVNSRRATIENINRALLQNQWIFIGLLTAFAGVLFFGSIVNASMVNLAERRREVATFRALGYGPWRIGGMFFRENLLTTIAGFACGLPVGYLLSVLTAASYQNDLLRLPVVTAPWVWAAGFAAAMIFALLAQGVVQVTIHRMDFLDALRVQE